MPRPNDAKNSNPHTKNDPNNNSQDHENKSTALNNSQPIQKTTSIQVDAEGFITVKRGRRSLRGPSQLAFDPAPIHSTEESLRAKDTTMVHTTTVDQNTVLPASSQLPNQWVSATTPLGKHLTPNQTWNYTKLNNLMPVDASNRDHSPAMKETNTSSLTIADQALQKGQLSTAGTTLPSRLSHPSKFAKSTLSVIPSTLQTIPKKSKARR